VVAGLCEDRLLAPCYFTGHCNADVFNSWIEQMFIPELQPGQTVILDNARFHQSTKTKELIEKAGCHLLFLPPYSPDYNPIEHRWFPLKNTARKIMQTFLDLTAAIETAIILAK
jgi:transposase